MCIRDRLNTYESTKGAMLYCRYTCYFEKWHNVMPSAFQCIQTLCVVTICHKKHADLLLFSFCFHIQIAALTKSIYMLTVSVRLHVCLHSVSYTHLCVNRMLVRKLTSKNICITQKFIFQNFIFTKFFTNTILIKKRDKPMLMLSNTSTKLLRKHISEVTTN